MISSVPERPARTGRSLLVNLKSLMVVAGASLALAACALPAEGILTRAQADCRAGDRTACRQLPYLIEQVRIAEQDREARAQAALLAISAYAASRPVYVAPAPVYIPHATNCTTSYIGMFATTNCY